MGSKKVEKDYKKFETHIEQMADDGLKKIRKETLIIKNQAEKVGQEVDATLSKSAEKKG